MRWNQKTNNFEIYTKYTLYCILNKIYKYFQIARRQDDLKKKLKVTFIGEPGLDMGGLTKEWFLLLIKQIFHEDYGDNEFQ